MYFCIKEEKEVSRGISSLQRSKVEVGRKEGDERKGLPKVNKVFEVDSGDVTTGLLDIESEVGERV